MSPRPMRLSGLLALVPLVVLSACGQSFFAPTNGKVVISVKWPKPAAGYAIKAIPQGTARIEVTILGEGIPGEQPQHTTLTPNGQDNSTDFMEVPVGPKVVQALAFDDQQREVAHGERAIAVLPNQLTEAVIELQAETVPVPIVSATPSPGPTATVTPSPAVSPSPTPTPVPAPIIVTVAGGAESTSTDAQDPLLARFHWPRAVTIDRGGRVLYISDNDNHLIRAFDLVSKAVSTVARLGGSPSATGGTVGGAATGLAIGPDGALYFADAESNQIRKLNVDGTIATIAGSGKAGADDGPSQLASFNSPVSLAFGIDGYLYIADQLNNRVRRINMRDAQLTVTTLAGTGAGGYKGDAGPAIGATLDLPSAVAVSPSGTVLYVAEAGGKRVRKIQLGTGIIDTAAGNGVSGRAGEGGSALTANLSLPLALAFDNLGHLYIADGWATHIGSAGGSQIGEVSRVLRIEDDGRLVRVAGELKTAYGYSGDGKSAVEAELNDPTGITFDNQGNLFIVDTYNNRLREVFAPQPQATPVPAPTATPAPTPRPTPVATTTPAAAASAAAS